MDRETMGTKQPCIKARGTRERILDASLSLFADRGFEAVTIREIAKVAEVNSALLYYYFQDKDDLYRQTIESVFIHQQQRIQVITEQGCGSAEMDLVKVATMYAHTLNENPDFIKIMRHELARDGTNIQGLADKVLRPNFMMICKVIERGIEDGTFQHLDPDLSALSLISMILFYFLERPVLRHLVGESGYSPKGLDAFLNHTTRLYFHGLLKPDAERRPNN